MGREKRRRGAYRVWWGYVREGDHLEDAGVDGRIRLKWIVEKWLGGMDWIDLTQDRYRGRAVVNA